MTELIDKILSRYKVEKALTMRYGRNVKPNKKLSNGVSSIFTVDAEAESETRSSGLVIKVTKRKDGHWEREQRAFDRLGNSNANIVPVVGSDLICSARYWYLATKRASMGDLLDYLMAGYTLENEDLKGVSAQIINALHHCHGANVAHLDLKAENIFLDSPCKGSTPHVYMGDFGSSFCAESPEDGVFFPLPGSILYSAPEVLSVFRREMPAAKSCVPMRRKAYNPFKADMWSLGVLLYLMAVGDFPFEGEDAQEQTVNALAGKVELLWGDKEIDEDFKDLVAALLNSSPEKRPGVCDILSHPYLMDHPILCRAAGG